MTWTKSEIFENRTGFPKSTLKISLIRFDMNNMGFLYGRLLARILGFWTAKTDTGGLGSSGRSSSHRPWSRHNIVPLLIIWLIIYEAYYIMSHRILIGPGLNLSFSELKINFLKSNWESFSRVSPAASPRAKYLMRYNQCNSPHFQLHFPVIRRIKYRIKNLYRDTRIKNQYQSLYFVWPWHWYFITWQLVYE